MAEGPDAAGTIVAVARKSAAVTRKSIEPGLPTLTERRWLRPWWLQREDTEGPAMSGRWQQRIVVGVSGSWASQAALGWAVGEARLRNAALHVIHAWDPDWHPALYARSAASRTSEQERQAASDRLVAAMRAEFGPKTPAGVTAELAEGVPERVLVERSVGLDLLVIGSSTTTDPVGWSAGPVVRACLMRAQCPLVLISTATSTPGMIRAQQLTPPCAPDTSKLTVAQGG